MQPLFAHRRRRRVAVDLPGAADRAVLHDRLRVGGEGIRGGAAPDSIRATSRRRSTRRWSPASSSTCIIIAVVTYVYPWQEIVSGHVRTEVAFERTFGSHAIAQLILFGAFLSLLKIFNGNFVAATRMLYAIGRRNLVHPSLGRVHATSRHAGRGDRADGGADGRGGDVRRRDPRADHRSRLAGGRRRLAVGLRRLSAAPARQRRRMPSVESPAMAWLGCAVSVGDHPDEGRARRCPAASRAPSGSRSPRGRRSGSCSGCCASTSRRPRSRKVAENVALRLESRLRSSACSTNVVLRQRRPESRSAR